MQGAFYMPTRVFSGRGCVRGQGEAMKALGRHALIVTGAHSAKSTGALDDLTAALAANGQGYTVFDGAVPNPTVDSVYAGAAAARAAGADFVAAIGGGSPMDTAKAIALLAAGDIPREQLFAGIGDRPALPIVCIPTTSGTGSEVTQYAVLTNDAAQTKTSLLGPQLFPRLAYLDGGYTDRLPRRVTVNTAIDALSHCVEGLLSRQACGISDALAIEGCRRIAACFDALERDGLTPEQRDSLMLASTLGGMVISGTSTVAVHAMGYPLTYHHGIEHGRANGLLLGAFVEFCAARAPERAALALAACGCADGRALSKAMARLLGERESITRDEAAAYAHLAAPTGNVAKSVAVPTEAEIQALYESSLNIL